MEKGPARRLAMFSNMARQFGWELLSASSASFEADAESCAASVRVHAVTSGEVRQAVLAIYALDEVADATYPGAWPRGCRSLSELANLSDIQLERVGVTTLGQRVRLRRMAAAPSTVHPAPSTAHSAREPELSASPWPGAPDVYAAWRSARGSPSDVWVQGATAISSVGALTVLTDDIGWLWCLTLPVMAGLLGWSQRRGALGRSAASLGASLVLHFLLGMIVDPGTPERALLGGALTAAYVVASATWVGLGQLPGVLITQYRESTVPTVVDIATQMTMPLLPERLVTLGLTDADLPEASDRTLNAAGLVSPELRAAFRGSLLPRSGAATPMWRQFWPASVLGGLAVAWMILATGLALIEQDRQYKIANLEENRRQTQIATRAAQSAAQARADAERNRRCTFQCQRDTCSYGMFGSKHYGEFVSEPCTWSRYGWQRTGG